MPGVAVNPKSNAAAAATIRFLYSFGGSFLPSPTDGNLHYIGGYTYVLCVHRSISFAELLLKFKESCGSPVTLRCQLPNDVSLDTLISITDDEDLTNIIDEYDSLCNVAPSSSFTEIRAFLSPCPSKSLTTLTSPHPPTAATATIARSHRGSGKPPLYRPPSRNLKPPSLLC